MRCGKDELDEMWEGWTGWDVGRMNSMRCGKDKLEKMWEGWTGEDVGRMNWRRCGNNVVVALGPIYQHLPVGTGRNHEKPRHYIWSRGRFLRRDLTKIEQQCCLFYRVVLYVTTIQWVQISHKQHSYSVTGGTQLLVSVAINAIYIRARWLRLNRSPEQAPKLQIVKSCVITSDAAVCKLNSPISRKV
jgi:hypothetical protein